MRLVLRAALPVCLALMPALTGCSSTPRTPAPTPTRRVVVVSGGATLGEVVRVVEMSSSADSPFTLAGAGQRARVGAQIRTGEASGARLDLDGGGFVRLAANTLITVCTLPVTADEPLIRVKLATGKLWVSLKGGGVEVQTPAGVGAVRGSFAEFEFWPQSATNPGGDLMVVRCLEGLCGVEAPNMTLMILGDLELATLMTGGQPPDRAALSSDTVSEFVQNNPESAGLALTLDAAGLAHLPSSTPTDTATATPRPAPSLTRAATGASSPTRTPTQTVVPTGTVTRTRTATATSTPVPTGSVTPTPTVTRTSTATVSRTPTATPTRSPTSAVTATSTATPSPTSVPSATHTATPVAPSDTPTETAVPATATDTPTPSATPTDTPSPTSTDTPVPTDTLTLTP